MQKNYNKQIEKQQQVTPETLVVGIDIGNEFNAVALVDKFGKIYNKYPKVYNNHAGFNYFKEVIKNQQKTNGFTKVLVGLEPTGHYWRKIAYFAKAQDYEVRFVRTTAVRYQRELDESSSAKTDIRDAVTIANIVREGKYLDTPIKDGIYRQLRMLCKFRESLQRYNTAMKNILGAVLDDYFPELKKIFWSITAKGLRAILEECAFPQDILSMDIFKIQEILRKSMRRKAQADKKAVQIYKAAEESVGLKEVYEADRYRLKTSLEELNRLNIQLKSLEKQIKEILKKIPESEYLLSIPGVGDLSAAIFLGELGDFKNFRDYRGIVKYAGYDPIENDSGQNIGKKHISKKGRYLLRKILYYMSMSVRQRSEYFKNYYLNKLKNRNRFGQELRKKEALCAVAIKLIKVIFSMLKNGRCFVEKFSNFKLKLAV